MKPLVRLGLVLVLVVACVGPMTGCAQQPDDPASEEPVQVQAVPGTGVNRVTLTEQALKDLGISTAAVRLAKVTSSGAATRAATAEMTAVPTTAVIYDPKGAAWVYTTSAARTYVRAPIVIDHITDGLTYLRSGPPVGTQVVTVGASELMGAEYGVGGE